MIVLYFSGTGNTKYVAELFAKRMKCQSVSIENKCDFGTMIQNNKEIAFCFPIYGSTPPGIMRAFVKKYKGALQGKKLILLCTQALGSGDGARSLMDELKGVSCEVIYAEHFFMPNNICNIPFPVLPEKAYRRMARNKVQKIYLNLKRKKYKKRGFHPVSVMVGNMQRVPFKKIENEHAHSVKIKDTCSGCQRCVRSCPVDNLVFENGKVKAKGQCMFCYRCINLCPQKAITTWIDKPVKKQYLGLNGYLQKK